MFWKSLFCALFSRNMRWFVTSWPPYCFLFQTKHRPTRSTSPTSRSVYWAGCCRFFTFRAKALFLFIWTRIINFRDICDFLVKYYFSNKSTWEVVCFKNLLWFDVMHVTAEGFTCTLITFYSLFDEKLYRIPPTKLCKESKTSDPGSRRYRIHILVENLIGKHLYQNSSGVQVLPF